MERVDFVPDTAANGADRSERVVGQRIAYDLATGRVSRRWLDEG